MNNRISQQSFPFNDCFCTASYLCLMFCFFSSPPNACLGAENSTLNPPTLPAPAEVVPAESGQAGETGRTTQTVSEPDTTAAAIDPLPEPETPLEVLRKTFLPPPDAKSLSRDSRLWVDRTKNRVYIDGYVAIDRGPLEMFACPYGTKEHESVVATVARSSEVHAALLAVGAKSGTTVRFDPAFLPPTGQRIRVWVTWRDQEKKFHACDARTWVRDMKSGEQLEPDWVFAGSGFWTDPSDNKQYYMGDGGDMICVSNFSTAMLDIGAASSASAESLLYEPFSERIPERGTLVRLVLVPIALPTDKPDPEAEERAKLSEQLPSEETLQLK